MERIKAFFRYSETILWARFLILLGVLAAVLPGIDMSAVIPAKWMWIYLIGIGLITELARRRKNSRDPV